MRVPKSRQCYHTLGRDFVWRMTCCSGWPHFEHIDDVRKSSLTFSMPNFAAPTHRPAAALIEASKGGGHARSGQLLGTGSKQSILLNVAAPRAFVRQMESTSHDPFATLAACGCGRIGCTRHNLAGNGVRLGAGAAARGLCPDPAFGQLSRRPARG